MTEGLSRSSAAVEAPLNRQEQGTLDRLFDERIMGIPRTAARASE